MIDSPAAVFIREGKAKELRLRIARYLYDNGPDDDLEFEMLLQENVWPLDARRKVVKRQKRSLFWWWQKPPAHWEPWMQGHLAEIASRGIEGFRSFQRLKSPQYHRLDLNHLQVSRRSRYNEVVIEKACGTQFFLQLVEKKHGPDSWKSLGFETIRRIEVDVWVPAADPNDPLLDRYEQLPDTVRMAVANGLHRQKPTVQWDIEEPVPAAPEVIDLTAI